jgi:3D-(3,5/4)-trihydroxycyclohexane-1,2-dione acylhydrolase (decyclizing)
MNTRRMTVSQALVEFLANQWTIDRDANGQEIRERTIPGMFGIFGHGNVAGIGQALKQANVDNPELMPYYQARNEQAMVHQAVGYARMHRRRGTYASAASVGPGATNMLTGAALATTNRLPALLLPSDTFATRVADPVLQQLEQPHDIGLTVNDAFRPVSKFFDRVQRPEQLFSIALAAMRVLTDPAETGAVTISLPEDVQAEAMDVPLEFLQLREWRIRRPRPERDAFAEALAALRGAKRPMIIAGGGVLAWDHPQNLGGVGATGTLAANRIAAEADVIIGIGTRYSDFTTSSRTAFQHPGVTFININVASFDAYKHGTQLAVVADARETLLELIDAHGAGAEGELRVDSAYAERIATLKAEWDELVDTAFEPSGRERPGQSEIIGAVQRSSDPKDVIVQAAGSLPGDLHKLWRVRDALGYHVEYAFSCMGYEIAGGLGAKRGLVEAGDDRDVIVMVGDGSYLMLNTELATAVAEGIKLIVVLIQNHGYASIGHLSETVGSERFGTWYREYDADAKNFQGEQILPVDLAMNARSYGMDVIEVEPGASAIKDLEAAMVTAKASDRATRSFTSTVIRCSTRPMVPAGGMFRCLRPRRSRRPSERAPSTRSRSPCRSRCRARDRLANPAPLLPLID